MSHAVVPTKQPLNELMHGELPSRIILVNAIAFLKFALKGKYECPLLLLY